jgi:hypothetical protein
VFADSGGMELVVGCDDVGRVAGVECADEAA